MTSLRLSQMEEMLENYSFMRIHRSFLVNLKEITSVDTNGNLVYFKEKQVPFSRRYKESLLIQMKLVK